MKNSARCVIMLPLIYKTQIHTEDIDYLFCLEYSSHNNGFHPGGRTSLGDSKSRQLWEFFLLIGGWRMYKLGNGIQPFLGGLGNSKQALIEAIRGWKVDKNGTAVVLPNTSIMKWNTNQQLGHGGR